MFDIDQHFVAVEVRTSWMFTDKNKENKMCRKFIFALHRTYPIPLIPDVRVLINSKFFASLAHLAEYELYKQSTKKPLMRCVHTMFCTVKCLFRAVVLCMPLAKCQLINLQFQAGEIFAFRITFNIVSIQVIKKTRAKKKKNIHGL